MDCLVEAFREFIRQLADDLARQLAFAALEKNATFHRLPLRHRLARAGEHRRDVDRNVLQRTGDA
ncbi:MAG: hypothetical protein M3Q69_07535, partial [Acidobacteriota bacterium]|nr:hypothetical protein [Acidobacteriota bacterium]